MKQERRIIQMCCSYFCVPKRPHGSKQSKRKQFSTFESFEKPISESAANPISTVDQSEEYEMCFSGTAMLWKCDASMNNQRRRTRGNHGPAKKRRHHRNQGRTVTCRYFKRHLSLLTPLLHFQRNETLWFSVYKVMTDTVVLTVCLQDVELYTSCASYSCVILTSMAFGNWAVFMKSNPETKCTCFQVNGT